MSSVPLSVGVFFGQIDKRATGWYWTDTRSDKPKPPIQGPFETREQAIEDANRSASPQQAPSNGPQESGAA
jgi:hypothetical protein